MQQVKTPNVNLKNTTLIKAENDGVVFQQGFILRKVSRILTQSSEDSFMYIPVFYDVKTNKILTETIPKEIQSEYKDYSF